MYTYHIHNFTVAGTFNFPLTSIWQNMRLTVWYKFSISFILIDEYNYEISICTYIVKVSDDIKLDVLSEQANEHKSL